MLGKLSEYLKLKIRGEYSIEMLKKRGLLVGDNFSNNTGVIIDPDHCWLIEIGNNVVFGPRVHVLAHDASTNRHNKYTKIARVKISDNVFIGASTVVLPGVSIGENVIIGAGSVVSKDIPSNLVAAGNPARAICSIEDYNKKYSNLINERPLYNDNWTLRKPMSQKMKELQREALVDGCGFVE
ncbi:acyltransferase [Bacillus sp. ISL-18]|uniref:DapH/DapD/GlmU-related protein n=1 Tax=Bacillus sp. ISL-18 TaxID=2819118 RepID=UPI001BE5EE41|nr:DapH/DapD/GlmU-related protein [Bacillus sp. ISL-18]MBT2657086.1 acyltransferase [Bacillus sp. ISL-18]